MKSGICLGQHTCMRERSSRVTAAGGHWPSGRTTSQAAGHQDQARSPWPLWLLILLCLSLHLCQINHLDTLFLYHSKAESSPNHWEVLSQPWLWVSLMGTNKYFIWSSPLFIKNLLKSKFWTLAIWGSSKHIIKMRFSHTPFCHPPKTVGGSSHYTVPSIALYSTLISCRNPDFHTPSSY